MILETDLLYANDQYQRHLDVMVPDGSGPFPVVVCIHGGGWQQGVKEDMYPYAEWLLEIGVASVLPNYRLTGVAPHPAQQDDVRAAMHWMADYAEDYRFDLSRVGLTGVSAGGHLSALIGCRESARDDTPYRIRCMYPVCPPTDMVRFLDDNPGIRPVIEALVGGRIEDRLDVIADVSPITHVHPNAPACVCVHGSVDNLVPNSQSTVFVEALKRAGVDAEAILVPGADHAAFQPGKEPLEPLGGLAPFLDFFRKHLL